MQNKDYENRGDLKISGSGSAGGGNYNNVKISGSGKIDGDIDCSTIAISGSGKIGGGIVAERVKISGSAKITGNVKAEEVRVSGGASFGGDVEGDLIAISGFSKIVGSLIAKEVSVSGSLSLENKLEGEDIKLRGAMSCKSCEGESFDSDGAFKIDELLAADTIQISLRGRCEAKEIGGSSIRVQESLMKKGIFQSLFGGFLDEGSLYADTIEGDEIYLENTKANTVRGAKVVIGSGCTIENLEYKESLEVDEKSKVKTSAQIK